MIDPFSTLRMRQLDHTPPEPDWKIAAAFWIVLLFAVALHVWELVWAGAWMHLGIEAVLGALLVATVSQILKY